VSPTDALIRNLIDWIEERTQLPQWRAQRLLKAALTEPQIIDAILDYAQYLHSVTLRKPKCPTTPTSTGTPSSAGR